MAAEVPLQWVSINQGGEGVAERAELYNPVQYNPEPSKAPLALLGPTERVQNEDVEGPHLWRDSSITSAPSCSTGATLGSSCSITNGHLYNWFFSMFKNIKNIPPRLDPSEVWVGESVVWAKAYHGALNDCI